MLDLPSSSQPAQDISSFSQPSVAVRSLSQLPSKPLETKGAPAFDKASTLVGANLEPPKVVSPVAYYIQATVTRHSSQPSVLKAAFLTTNLSNLEDAKVTEVAPIWSIGRSSNCAIAILNPSISRCHAVIDHIPIQGFYITDLGSSNGTFVNRQRLPILERRSLTDGDLISFSHIHVEFFVSH